MKFSRTLLNSAAASMLALTSASAIAADTDSLQQQIESLKAQNKIIMERLETTADMIESGSSQSAGHNDDHGATDSLRDKTFGHHGNSGTTTIGGYGELHYNNTDSTNAVSMHRFILFMGHEFSDRIRFWSELEVENSQAGDGMDGGEVAMEQAFLEFDLNDNHAVRAGILLVPVGLINETHEPPTFYGVERNNVEKYIIPTTWREGGISLTGRFGEAFSYDLAAHTGLKLATDDTPATVYTVRDARKSARKAPAQDPAYTARIIWRGIAGLELGGAIQYQRDVSQGEIAQNAGSATLMEAHAVWQAGAATVRALYAGWNINGTGPATAGSDKQSGWYVEPSYKLSSKLGLFARQSGWDNAPNSGTNTENTQTDFGLNYWPHENVVVKVDYQIRDKAGTNDDGFNLGVGYQF